eukprot:1446243-Prymnesium_polylepis.1
MHRSALAPNCRPDVRVPTRRHPLCTPGLCGAQLSRTARSGYNSMDEWGECHTGERDRWQRAP